MMRKKELYHKHQEYISDHDAILYVMVYPKIIFIFKKHIFYDEINQFVYKFG
jgi:hypothetical protein